MSQVKSETMISWETAMSSAFFKNLNIDNFPVDENRFEQRCNCCNKGMFDGYKLYLRDEYYACSKKCFIDILYYSGHYMFTTFDEGDIDVSNGDCFYDSDGNAYWSKEYLEHKESKELLNHDYYDEDEEQMNS